MSFFDEVETTVANTRLLQAVEDSGPISLKYAPIESLTDLDTKLKNELTINNTFSASTLANYLFKQFLLSNDNADAVSLINLLEDYRKSTSRDRSSKARIILALHPSLQPSGYVNKIDVSKLNNDGTSLSKNFTNEINSNNNNPNSNTNNTNNPPTQPLVSASVAPLPTSSGSMIAPVKSHNNNSNNNNNNTLTTDPTVSGSNNNSNINNTNHVTVSIVELWNVDNIIVSNHHRCCSSFAEWNNNTNPMAAFHKSLTDIFNNDNNDQNNNNNSNSHGVYPVELFDPIRSLLGEVLLSSFNEFKANSPLFQKLVQLTDYSQRNVKLEDFRVFRVLGRGAFGAVSCVQKLDTHAMFAMKEMGKKQVKFSQSEWMVMNEKKVLSKMKSPFVLNLKYSFHNEESFYLIFDMCAGGDLKYHLRETGGDGRFSMARAKFYAAEVLLGLEFLHSLDIVYRDLKPNNILLDISGHVKISDLGLTIKLRKNKVLKHLAGTAGYWAPEIVMKTGTYKSSDWWSFGTFLYEMLSGKRPKCTCNKKSNEWCPFGQNRTMEENALKEDGLLKLDVTYPPECFDKNARDLCEKLFVVDPKTRLGANGTEEIKSHPFFADIDWEKLSALQLTPPFIPDQRTVYADSIGGVGDMPKGKFKKVKIEAADEASYEGFTYTSPEAVESELVEALKKIDCPNKDNLGNQGNGGEQFSDGQGGCCVVL